LAQDISLALVTTVVGLVIAIASLTVYMYLAGRVDALVMEMDELAQRVVHCISAESLAERAARPRRAARAADSEPPAAKKKAV
jgi:biopolymer transport protein ExbB